MRPTSPTWRRDRRIISWALFDLANTPFVVVIGTIAFPTYFKEVVVEGARSGDLLWGLTGSISMILVALTAPVTGAYADRAGAKRRLLLAYTIPAIVCTALLATVGAGMVAWGMLLIVLANVGFQGGQVFYNAFLPEISDESTWGTVSGLGFAAGYVGALLSLLFAFPFMAEGYETANLDNVHVLYLIVAAWWAVLAVPTFVYLKDRRPASAIPSPDTHMWTATAGDLTDPSSTRADVRPSKGTATGWVDRVRALRSERDAFRFLLAFFFYTDAMTTMIAFIAIYARETLGLTFAQIIVLYVASELTAIPGSYALGLAADRVGAKPTLTVCLALWLVILVLGALARDFWLFMPIAMMAGVGTGALQAVSRSMMAQLAPRQRQGEFFGFYALAGRLSAILGPVLFGAVSSISGNQRFAIVSLMVLMALGLVILQTVRAPKTTTAPPVGGETA